MKTESIQYSGSHGSIDESAADIVGWLAHLGPLNISQSTQSRVNIRALNEGCAMISGLLSRDYDPGIHNFFLRTFLRQLVGMCGRATSSPYAYLS